METFSALLGLCTGNSPVPVNFPRKGQWHGALMFSLICAWTNDWVNSCDPGDLRRHRGHYDVNVMEHQYANVVSIFARFVILNQLWMLTKTCVSHLVGNKTRTHGTRIIGFTKDCSLIPNIMTTFTHIQRYTSLPPGGCGSNFKSLIFKLSVQNKTLCERCEIVLSRKPHNVTNEKSKLVSVMATWVNVDPDLCRHMRSPQCVHTYTVLNMSATEWYEQ